MANKCCDITIEPKIPVASDQIVSNGKAKTKPIIFGITNRAKGETPIVVNASISSLTFIAPISELNAVLVLAAAIKAVIKGQIRAKLLSLINQR